MGLEQPLKPIRISKGNIISQVRTAYKYKGLFYLVSTVPRCTKSFFFTTVPNFFWLSYYRLFKSSETFEFQGNSYHYLFHAYCPTWKNERAVIIPIAWDMVQKCRYEGKEILEIGNMLSYVFKVDHDIIDKYEVADGIINEDVADFNSSKRYDLIISIFTLQWVGRYESPPEPAKAMRTIENLKRHLAHGGKIVVIHGFGENPDMDKLIRKGTLRFDKCFYLQRVSGYKWKETTWEDVKDKAYDRSIPTANGVVIGIIYRASQ
jgi:SAM-dependent methyltransferase